MNWRFWQHEKPVPSALEQRDQWLEWMLLGGSKKSTVDGYRQITNRLLDRFPELLLAEFNDDHVLGIIEDANPASRQSLRGAYANLFGWAYRTKRVPRNLMDHVPTFKQPPPPPIECFNEVERKALCSLPDPDGALMAVLFGTGIRKSEARNLRVRRVDLDNAELHVIDGAKGDSVGVVALSARLVSRLAGYFLTEGLNEDDFLWYCHPGGTPVRRHDRAIADGAIHNWWARCIDQAGVRYRKLHTTRHTFATELRRNGVALDDLSFLLRHADPRTTRKVYDHTRLIDIRVRAEAALEALV